ncbi:hypothetical protein [Lacinutrix sp. MedPE-SW]|uniref:hypothetical protein n=1 Tax=Lacinutrix sp. MedPE-SW TaxID=1860087 RepID=UPI0025BCFC78|nr:hypothetical protein [Lacinutrix sp. MedPE-SW]
MKNLVLLILLLSMCFNCSTSKTVKSFKNPETETFYTNKILVIGMTADVDLRREFEKKVSKMLENNNVIAVKSIDFFEQSFVDNAKTIEELNAIETQLLTAGFDAIILTKVTGKQEKVAFGDYYKNIEDKFKTFEDYYYKNQNICQNKDPEVYIVYSTQTTLYCICPDKERELLWQANIEVAKTKNTQKNISDYTKTLYYNLKENKLLIF